MSRGRTGVHLVARLYGERLGLHASWIITIAEASAERLNNFASIKRAEMNLEDLKCFANVVEHGGFGAAERSTGERRAKLSRRVQRLEADLGSQLIKRSTRRFQVTEFGQAVLRQWNAIAERLDATEEIAAQFRSGISGNLRVSCPPSIARYLGSNFIAEFMKKYPDVSVEFHLTAREVDLVRERFDFAISGSYMERDDQSLIMRTLARPRRILVASPEFLEENPAINLHSLGNLPTLSVGDNVTALSWTLCNDAGEMHIIHHRPRLVSNDSGGVRDAALHGMGIAMLSIHACESDLKSGALLQILPEWQSFSGQICIFLTNKKWVSPAARALIEQIARRFEEYHGG